MMGGGGGGEEVPLQFNIKDTFSNSLSLTRSGINIIRFWGPFVRASYDFGMILHNPKKNPRVEKLAMAHSD